MNAAMFIFILDVAPFEIGGVLDTMTHGELTFLVHDLDRNGYPSTAHSIAVKRLGAPLTL